jgi:hypothetical protein
MKKIISYKEFLNESKSAIVTEANQEEQIKKEVISKLSDFFGCAPGNLSKFNFDGKDNIKELTKALRSTSDEGTEQYYKIAIQMAKRDLGIHEAAEFVGIEESVELNEAVNTADDLASFIAKEEKHFAAFLKPKKLSAVANGDIVTIKPASGSFTITVDFKKSTIDTTGKPAYPESVSYVELMEYVKITKFKLNESEEVNEKMDTKYWSDYNVGTSGQMPKEHSVWHTNFEDAFEDAVTDWQYEAEEKLNSSQIKKIRKMAEEYFKIEKKISIAVIQAMIMQES